MEVLWNGFNDSKYRPCALLKSMVSSGLLGKKTGRGFYNMINFNLSEEQLLIKKTAKEFAKNELLSGAIERDDKKIWPSEQIKKNG